MYKLLIADDEQIVVDSVKFIVEKYMGNNLIIETARSGKEAIEKVEVFRPDIVIIDIKMPGISGLDAIGEIKKIHSGALFIIITAYASFNYAKEALQLGAIEYINKPLSRTKIISAIENAIRIKDKERNQLKTELEFKEKMAFILPALENSFIYSLVFSDDHTLEMESLKRILDIECESGYIMTIEFGDGKNKDGLINKIGSGIKSQNIYPFMRNAIKDSIKCIVGPIMLNRIIAYIPCNADIDEYRQRVEALKKGAEILEKLRSTAPNIDFYIGIGKSYPIISDIYKSYEESLRAIEYADESSVIHISDIQIENSFQKTPPQGIENALIKKITAGQTEESLITFETLFGQLKRECGNNLDALKSNLIELVVLIWRIYKDYSPENTVDVIGSHIAKFLSINNLKDLKVWVKDSIRQISVNMAHIRQKKLSGIIRSAINYIEKNYSRDITLEEVAINVNITPTYFSKLFKEEVGTNFIDYLTEFRIEKAKQMIANGTYSNKEISYFIGYSDPNYFSRVFKKIVGMTPTEYKASLIE